MNRYLPAAFLAAACLLTACTTTTTTTNTTTARTTSASASPTPAARATATSAAAQMSVWWYGDGDAYVASGQSNANTIFGDIKNISLVGNVSPADVTADCTTLANDLTAAKSYRPAPEAQARQLWSAAMNFFQQATTDCRAGASGKSVDLLTKAGAEIQAGRAELNAATARIAEDAG